MIDNLNIKITRTRVILTLLICLLYGTSYAQNGKYGATPEDSILCIQNLSLYIEFYKQKNYADAMMGWRWVFNNCPKSSLKMYASGAKMYKLLIRKEKDADKKTALVDTLFMVYDQRIVNYKQEGFVLGLKGVDMLQYRKDNLEESYNILAKSVALEAKKSKAGAVTGYFQSSIKMLEAEKIEKEKVIEIYDVVITIIEYQIGKLQGDKYAKKREFYEIARDNVNILFEPVANCDDLKKIYTAQFESKKEDAEWLKRAAWLMNKKECTDDPLFAKIAETLHNLEPSAVSAYNMGKMMIDKKQFSKATTFLKQAIELQEDPLKKADYYFMLAKHYFRNLKQFAAARGFAQKAASLHSGWGKPYLLIGDLYAASSKDCGTEDFEKSAVYWVAVDKYIRAKSIDGSISEEANKKIATWSKYFPTKKDAFFYNYTEGKSYSVACWINETTTVRVQ